VVVKDSKEAIEAIQSTRISPPFGSSTAKTLGGDRNGDAQAKTFSGIGFGYEAKSFSTGNTLSKSSMMSSNPDNIDEAEELHLSCTNSAVLETQDSTEEDAPSYVMDSDGGQPDCQALCPTIHAEVKVIVDTSPSVQIHGEDPTYLSDSGSAPMDFDSEDDEQYQTAYDVLFSNRLCLDAAEEDIAPPLSVEVIPSVKYLVADKIGSSEVVPLRVENLPSSMPATDERTESVDSLKTANPHAGMSDQGPKLKPQAPKAAQKKSVSAVRIAEWRPTTKKDSFLPTYK
tara:strand:- start:47 stop:904 length:858 start_codon:yes stop_codon:yes gene_type:complete